MVWKARDKTSQKILCGYYKGMKLDNVHKLKELILKAKILIKIKSFPKQNSYKIR